LLAVLASNQQSRTPKTQDDSCPQYVRISFLISSRANLVICFQVERLIETQFWVMVRQMNINFFILSFGISDNPVSGLM
jgi:hypothetical protein